MNARNSHISALSLASALLFTGCVGLEFNSNVPEDLEEIAAGISIGETTRAQLHADLGEPLGSSEDGTVEVRRAASGHDVEALVWLGPAPPLFGWSDVTGYLMVRYDADGIVQDVKSDFTAEWEPNYSDRGDHRRITLSLPPYDFHARYVHSGYEDFLVVATPDRWAPLPSGQCRLVFIPYGSNFLAYTRRLYIDDTQVLTYRDNASYDADATASLFMFQFILPAGHHTAAVQIERYEKERIEAEWTCSDGETLRLSDQVELGDRPDLETWLSPGFGPVGSLHIFSAADPQSLKKRMLVLYHSGLSPNAGTPD